MALSGHAATANGALHVLVADAAGRIAYAKDFMVGSGDFRVTLDLDFLPAGAYFAIVRGADATGSVRFSIAR